MRGQTANPWPSSGRRMLCKVCGTQWVGGRLDECRQCVAVRHDRADLRAYRVKAATVALGVVAFVAAIAGVL